MEKNSVMVSAAVVALFAAASQVHAIGVMHPASGCRARAATGGSLVNYTGTPLVTARGAIFNGHASENLYLTCPVVKSSTTADDSTLAAFGYVDDSTLAIGCTLYIEEIGTSSGSFASASSTSDDNQYYEASFANITTSFGSSWSHMECFLPAASQGNTYITAYRVTF